MKKKLQKNEYFYGKHNKKNSSRIIKLVINVRFADLYA